MTAATPGVNLECEEYGHDFGTTVRDIASDDPCRRCGCPPHRYHMSHILGLVLDDDVVDSYINP